MSTDGPGLRLASADVSSSDLGVYTVIGALMVVGVVLILLAAWLFKATKPEMELLAPLERMSDRSWKKLEPAVQREELDSLRPDGARPVDRSATLPEPDTAEPDDDAIEETNTGPTTSASEVVSPASTVASRTDDRGPGDDTSENDPPDLLDLDVEPVPPDGEEQPDVETDDSVATDDDAVIRDPSSEPG